MTDNKLMAVTTARQWLGGSCLILDTETTGLDGDAEIVEIAIINGRGDVILDTLIKPSKSIPDEATAIHGITDEMVANAPRWSEVHHGVCGLIARSGGFVAYNSQYDARLINQTAVISGEFTCEYEAAVINVSHDCAMLLYAEFYGQWDDHRSNYKWQRLTAAAEQQGIKVIGQPHRALADCLLTLGVIKAIAAGGAA